MIPDKIYLTSTPYRILDGWCDSKTPIIEGMEQIEYIRKEALIEWAKETYLCENASAIRKVCFKQLIDKLNSL